MSLARQMTSAGNKASLTRLNQLTDQLEAGFDAIHGKGVIAGGFVNRTGNFAVSVESTGTTLYAYGKTLTLASDAAYSSIPDHATVYLWGKITRTSADPTAPTAEDTYALTLTHDTAGTAPSADHFLLAGPIDAAGGIGTQADIENNPVGKYLPIPRTVTLATEAVAIPAVNTWYLVTADFSAVGAFSGPEAFDAYPGIATAGVVAVEQPSHKTAGKAAWKVMLPASVAAAGSFNFSPVLYGHGFTGTDLTLIAATWAITAAPTEIDGPDAFTFVVTCPVGEDRVVKVDFTSLGSFADGSYTVILDHDQDDEKTIAWASDHGKTGTEFRLIVQNASDAAAGTHLTAADVQIVCTLKGRGWTDAGSPSAPTVTVTAFAGGTAEFLLLSGGSMTGAISVTRALTSSGVISSKVTGDSTNRFALETDGRMKWGDGTTQDVLLYRRAADQLKTDDKFLAALGIGVGNSAAGSSLGTVTKKIEVFDASGTSLGFVPVYDAIT